MVTKKYSDRVRSVPGRVSEPELLYAVRHHDITTQYLSDLKVLSGLKDEVLSESLNMNIKTFRNYRMNILPMKPHLQEHVIAMLALFRHGIEVFGSHKSFNEWLDKGNVFMDSDRPMSFLTTISGIKHVDNRLTAIKYGDNV